MNMVRGRSSIWPTCRKQWCGLSLGEAVDREQKPGGRGRGLSRKFLLNHRFQNQLMVQPTEMKFECSDI